MLLLAINTNPFFRGTYITYRTNVVVEKDDHGYYAYCPDLPGCQSQGESFAECQGSNRTVSRDSVGTGTQSISQQRDHDCFR